ncbi:MAG TPA: leucine-rich repeat domain-containing protein [Cellvibrionaceae bacterium]
MYRLYRLVLPVTLALLTACSNYNVSVNDRVVYTPLPLFSDYQLSDDSLAGCVQQTISDEKITSARDLTRLRCTSAGIKDLSGIEKFAALEQLDLSDNELGNIAPLAKLGRLNLLLLRNNQLDDLSPLLPLLKLTDLNIEENPDINCTDVAQIRANIKDNNGRLLSGETCAN